MGLFYLIAIIPDSFLRTRITTFEPSFDIYLFLVLLQCQAVAMVDKDSATALHSQLPCTFKVFSFANVRDYTTPRNGISLSDLDPFLYCYVLIGFFVFVFWWF